MIATHGPHHLLCHLDHLRIFHHLLHHGVVHHICHVWWDSAHAWLTTSATHSLVLHAHLLSLFALVDGGRESDVFDFLNHWVVLSASTSRAWHSFRLCAWLLGCLRSGIRPLCMCFLGLLHQVWVAFHHARGHFYHLWIHHVHDVCELLVRHLDSTVTLVLLLH